MNKFLSTFLGSFQNSYWRWNKFTSNCNSLESKKESVVFLGFGTFSTASRDARVSRIPGTDKTVNVPATTVAKFKVGKALKEAVASSK